MIIRALSACLFVVGALSATAYAQEDTLRVFMDHARVLKLDRPVSKVIVGNSNVADATVADARTIVVTGRNYGATNLVLLDKDGNAIFDQRVLVAIDEDDTVRVFKSTDRTVMSCTPNCEQRTSGGTAGSP